MRIKEVKEILEIQDVTPKDFSMEDLADKIGSDVTELRIINGITQKDLAEKINTKQSSIARLENGSSLPSLQFLYRIAKALNTFLIPPQFDAINNYNTLSDTSVTTSTIPTNNRYMMASNIQGEYFEVTIANSQDFINNFNLS